MTAAKPATPRKRPRQVRTGSSMAPAVDPKAISPAMAPKSRPKGRPRSLKGNRSLTRASAIGNTPLAPRPVSRRSASRAGIDPTAAVAAVRTRKARRDETMIGPRPTRSDNGP